MLHGTNEAKKGTRTYGARAWLGSSFLRLAAVKKRLVITHVEICFTTYTTLLLCIFVMQNGDMPTLMTCLP